MNRSLVKLSTVFLFVGAMLSTSAFASSSESLCEKLAAGADISLQIEAAWDKRNQGIMENIAKYVASTQRNFPIAIAIVGGLRSGKTELVRELREFFKSGNADRFVRSSRSRFQNLQELENNIVRIDVWKPMPVQEQANWTAILDTPTTSAANQKIYIFEFSTPLPESPFRDRLRAYDLYAWTAAR